MLLKYIASALELPGQLGDPMLQGRPGEAGVVPATWGRAPLPAASSCALAGALMLCPVVGMGIALQGRIWTNRATPHALHDLSIPPSPVVRWAGWVSVGAEGVVIIIIIICIVISALSDTGVGNCSYPGDDAPPQPPSGAMRRMIGVISRI